MEHSCCYGCPFTLALDILGDEWILVIVKQILIEGKETFTESEEASATNILSAKLKQAVSYLNANTPKPSAGFGVNQVFSGRGF